MDWTATDHERAEAFLRFAQADLTVLAPARVARLALELHYATVKHTDTHGVIVGVYDVGLLSLVTADDLRAIQTRLQMLIQGTLAGRNDIRVLVWGKGSGPLSLPLPYVLRGGRVLVVLGDSFAQAVLRVAVELLCPIHQAALIRRCAEPGCGVVFVRRRRQKYCSPVCTNRATQRAFRERLRQRKRRRPQRRSA